MTPREIFRRYVDERRAANIAGYKIDIIGEITRYTPIAPFLDGIVVFSQFSEHSIDDAISAQAEYFSGIGRAFEWKVYDFDTPADLAERLETKGFERGETEAFLVYRVKAHSSRKEKSKIRVERITTDAGVQQVVAIQEKVWERSFPWLESSLLESLERLAVYCAYVEDVAVGTGWIEFPDCGIFAELHGGAVVPAKRGCGIYSALFDIRAEEAKRRGIEFFTVDAAPMSRPILLHKGFTYVCDIVPFRKSG
jgi:GNAT superfamily N-acetyltransferase